MNYTSNGIVNVRDELRAYRLDTFMATPYPEPEYLLGKVLQINSINMLFAARGIGKTQFSLAMSLAVATGKPLGAWHVNEAAPVLYIDGEMQAYEMQKRMRSMLGDVEIPNNFYYCGVDDQADKIIPDLSTSEGRQTLWEMVEKIKPKLLVLDNKSCLMRTGKENDGDHWPPIHSWLRQISAGGICIVLVHHAAKNGGQRGSSRVEDGLGVVMELKRPDDYMAEEGARFELHFTKERNSSECLPQEFQLTTDENGCIVWEIKPVNNPYQHAVELLKDGVSQSDVADTLEKPKGTISKWRKRAIKEGLIEDK